MGRLPTSAIVDWPRAQQQQLAEQRRLALDSANLGWWHMDPATRNVMWDARFKTIYGVESNSLPFEKLAALIHPDDRGRVESAVAAATRPDHPQPYNIEYRVTLPDGDFRWVRAKGQAYFSGDGSSRRFTSFAGTVGDISEERANQDALRASEGEFRKLADSMPQIVWAANPDGVRNYYNRRWFEYINLSENAGDAVGWERYVHPDDLPRVAERWLASLKTGEVYSLEFRVRGGDGQYRSFLVRAPPRSQRRRDYRPLVWHLHRHRRPKTDRGRPRAPAGQRTGGAGGIGQAKPDQRRVSCHPQPRDQNPAQCHPRVVPDYAWLVRPRRHRQRAGGY